MRNDSLHTYRIRRYAAWLKGWDAAVTYRSMSENPYSRSDFRSAWDNGFRRCEVTSINPRPGYDTGLSDEEKREYVKRAF